jgi:hypothetical protein
MSLILLLASAFAIEQLNPILLCDRFKDSGERKQCEEQMAKLEPDWFLASVCDKQIDDLQFYDCLITAQTLELSPKKLAACERQSMADELRVECVRNAKVSQLEASFKPTPDGSEKLIKSNKK